MCIDRRTHLEIVVPGSARGSTLSTPRLSDLDDRDHLDHHLPLFSSKPSSNGPNHAVTHKHASLEAQGLVEYDVRDVRGSAAARSLDEHEREQYDHQAGQGSS